MKNKKGFTLVELLAVIAILAVLVLLALPNVLKQFSNAKKNSFVIEAQEIAKSVSSDFINYSLKGERVSVFSSDGEYKVDISGGNSDYYIETDSQGNITYLEVTNDSFCLQTEKNYKDITSDDISDGRCDPTNRLSKEEKEQLKKEQIIEEKYNKEEYLKTTTYNSPYLGISNFDKKTIKRIYTLATTEIPENAVASWDVSVAGDGSIMAWEMLSDTSGMYDLYIGQEGGVIANKDSSYLFCYFDNIKLIDLSNLNTSKVTNMSAMFYSNNDYGSSAKTYGPDEIIFGSSFDTSKVTDMSYMFYGMSNIETLDLRVFNTKNVTNMSHMFSFNAAGPWGKSNGIKEIIIDESFDTSNVTTMEDMFWGNGRLENIDFSLFNTSNVTTMEGMFTGLYNMNKIDLSSFNTSKVTTMEDMFSWTQTNEIIISSFDTSNVIEMSGMFGNGKYKKIVIPNTNGNTTTQFNGKNTSISGTFVLAE